MATNMCLHNRRIGDNYGETCLDCGEKLSGYGSFAKQGGPCIHRWVKLDSGGWQCVHCEMETAVDPTIDN